MHTFVGSKGTVFHFNQDYSGDVIIQRRDEYFRLPAIDLLEYAANYIMNKRIDELESMTWEQLLT